MSALIEKDFDFQAGVYFQNNFVLNTYSITLAIDVNTDSIAEQNVAMERIKYLVYECFESCIFVDEAEAEIIKKYNDVGLKVCTLPDEPYDQIVALIVILKLNAVCESRLRIEEIVLTSKLSDDIRFKERLETAQENFKSNSWYHDVTPNIVSNKKDKKDKDKIVKIKNNEWKSIGLLWNEPAKKSTEIIFNIDPEK
jgi:hypothetical protein